MPSAANLGYASPPTKLDHQSRDTLPSGVLASRLTLHTLRWPVAWLLACAATLLMLTCLGIAATRVPRRLSPPLQAAILAPHATTEKSLNRETAPATTKSLPAHSVASEQTPRAQPARESAPVLNTTGTPPENPDVVALSATEAVPSPRSNAGAEAKAPPTASATGSAAASSDSGHIAARNNNGTGGDTLAQRCPQQVEPSFPQRAQDDDISQGRVLARFQIDASGRVENVEILSAEPPGYFEREVRRVALKWRCLATGHADSVRVPFQFRLN